MCRVSTLFSKLHDLDFKGWGGADLIARMTDPHVARVAVWPHILRVLLQTLLDCVQAWYGQVTGAIFWVKNILCMLRLERNGIHFSLSPAVPFKTYYVILNSTVNKYCL